MSNEMSALLKPAFFRLPTIESACIKSLTKQTTAIDIIKPSYRPYLLGIYFQLIQNFGIVGVLLSRTGDFHFLAFALHYTTQSNGAVDDHDFYVLRRSRQTLVCDKFFSNCLHFFDI